MSLHTRLNKLDQVIRDQVRQARGCEFCRYSGGLIGPDELKTVDAGMCPRCEAELHPGFRAVILRPLELLVPVDT